MHIVTGKIIVVTGKIIIDLQYLESD